MLTIITSICTGLGLFLLGMKLLTSGLNQITSSRFRNTLLRLKIHPLVGVLIGILFTSLLQSSSSTTVILVSLVEANLLTLYQVTPIIMGANIGTTITAQLIAFRLGKYAPFLLILGIILSLFRRHKKTSFAGEVFIGLSLVFLGIEFLSQGASPLKDILRFQQILAELGDKPFLGILMGFSTTAIIQSSSTGIAILQSLAFANSISLPAAITILLGQNIGTCVTTLLASIHLSTSGKRAAFIHLLFNVLGVIVIFPFITLLCELAIYLSPTNLSRQIANAHSLFNVFSTLLFLPFVPWFVKATTFFIKK